MRARDVMTSPVITVTAETSAKEAAKILVRHGFTALPVVDDDDQLVGIITEADLARDRILPDPRSRISSERHDFPELINQTVGSLMSKPVVAVRSDVDVAEIAKVFLGKRIRVVPIVDGDQLVGIVTRRDIIGPFARKDSAIAADVRRHLEIYGGVARWTVNVRNGVVSITDTFDNKVDHHVAKVLAMAVPGVVGANVTCEIND